MNTATSLIYTPILKWKAAERWALGHLALEDKGHLLPLLEIVLPNVNISAEYDKLPPPEKQELREEASINAWSGSEHRQSASKVAKSIYEHWGTGLVMVDFTCIYPAEAKSIGLSELSTQAESYGLNVIPVVNLGDQQQYKDQLMQSLKTTLNGVCVRLVASDLENLERLNIDLGKMIAHVNIDYGGIYLLIDLKDSVAQPSYQKAARILETIQRLHNWKAVIVAGGAFPATLADYQRGQAKIPRNDWTYWRRYIFQALPSHRANLLFADYTIRPPVYSFATQFFLPTCSLKYTVEADWLLMKGKVKDSEGYLAAAQILAGMPEFLGGGYSAGDDFILEKSDYYTQHKKTKSSSKLKTGNTQQWLQASINHHCVFVINQLTRKS